MESVKTFFRIERDPLYKWGEEKGAANERAKAEKKVKYERAKAEQEKYAERLSIARSLKKEGVAPETIAKTTGLSIEKVREL